MDNSLVYTQFGVIEDEKIWGRGGTKFATGGLRQENKRLNFRGILVSRVELVKKSVSIPIKDRG